MRLNSRLSHHIQLLLLCDDLIICLSPCLVKLGRSCEYGLKFGYHFLYNFCESECRGLMFPFETNCDFNYNITDFILIPTCKNQRMEI